jgi:hypothetical protein
MRDLARRARAACSSESLAAWPAGPRGPSEHARRHWPSARRSWVFRFPRHGRMLRRLSLGRGFPATCPAEGRTCAFFLREEPGVSRRVWCRVFIGTGELLRGPRACARLVERRTVPSYRTRPSYSSRWASDGSTAGSDESERRAVTTVRRHPAGDGTGSSRRGGRWRNRIPGLLAPRRERQERRSTSLRRQTDCGVGRRPGTGAGSAIRSPTRCQHPGVSEILSPGRRSWSLDPFDWGLRLRPGLGTS